MNRWYAEFFPNLNSANHTQKSPCDVSYNCVAWAAGKNNVFWWPREDHVWPIENKYGETIEAIVDLFNCLGYDICNNENFEKDYEKISIYAKCKGTRFTPTHVARQINNGYWSSKLGPEIDIIHQKVEDLSSPVYGKPMVFMKRKQSFSCS
jgi:hypothetical protein